MRNNLLLKPKILLAILVYLLGPSHPQWTSLECQELTQSLPEKINTFARKILGFNIPKKFHHSHIFELYKFKITATSKKRALPLHSFIRNFKHKARILVSADLSMFSKNRHLRAQPNFPSHRTRKPKTGNSWKQILSFLLHKNPFPNLLVVGLDLEVPARLLKSMHLFIHRVATLDELSFEQIELFDMIVVNPFKLCAGFSTKNFCVDQIESLLRFRDMSVFKSIYIVSKLADRAKNNEYVSSLYGLNSSNNQYFFNENYQSNQLFLEKFISVLTELPISVSVQYDEFLLRSNCMNHRFDFPKVKKMKDVDEHFEYFQKIDFTQFDLRSIAHNVKSIKKEVLQCLSTMKFEYNFFKKYFNKGSSV